MCMLDRRVQILLDRDRYRRIAEEARRRKTSVAQVVREAIDKAFPSDLTRKRAAADRILAAPTMPVPEDPKDLKRELDEIRGGGLA
jgi:hypothetical protein